MAKRVFEIARDLGVKSTAIIEKCKAEGIPKMENHMSSVSAGLEATIREWFHAAAAQSSHTAVETAAAVDLEKVRAKPRRAAKKSGGAEESGAGDSGEQPGGGTIAVAEPPVHAAQDRSTTMERPAPSRAPSVGRRTPAAPEEPDGEAVDRRSGATEDGDSDGRSRRPAAKAPESAPKAPHRREPPRRQPPKPPGPEPVMNVPSRPRVVAPAGPQLQDVGKARLSGPKVVRIEQPETVDRPARAAGPREGAPTSRGPRTGAGVVRPGRPGAPGAPGGPGGKDAATRGRNERRTGRRDSAFDPNFNEQDLIEREARLARAGGFLRQRRRDMRRTAEGGVGERALTAAQTGGAVKIAAPFTIKELSSATGIQASDIIKHLLMQGMMATVNSGIDSEKAQEIMLEYNIGLEVTEKRTAEESVRDEFAKRETTDERPRRPVVAILGHVDHGKTSLLDKIRNANVAAGEAGGITQATSAFRVSVTVAGEEKQIVFLDTPGHQAFTSMRARGANITDIVVLVVAADDGVMPQTIESISHAQAAGTPIVVALNKIDRPEATEGNIRRVLGQLAERGLNPAEWGGDTEVVKVSAVTGQGITELLETIDYRAQLLDLKADFAGKARGAVIEAAMVEGRGPAANMLVQDGELTVGDYVVAGRACGRVRDITDDRGQRVKSAGPATPVQISGLSELPDAGDKFFITDSLKKAQEAAEQRRQREREKELAAPKVSLDTLFSTMADAEIKELRVVVKADVQGSVEVLRKTIEELKTDEVRTHVLHSAVGGINETDVQLASASRAVIVGFNVIASAKARQTAEQTGVEIRTYQVIYDIVDDVKKALEGLLAPEVRQEILGHAEVRAVFKVTKVGAIAGCYVTDGVVERNALVRVTRGGIVVENDRTLEQLKRFKDDAKEVRAGQECGMKIAAYDDIKEGDVLECYRRVEVKRTI